MTITLVGHSCLDHIKRDSRLVHTRAGGVPVYALPTLLGMGRPCFVYTKYNTADSLITEALSAGGESVIRLPAHQTTVFEFDTVDGIVGEPIKACSSEPITAGELDFSRSETVFFAPLMASDIDAECFRAASQAGRRVVVDAQGLTREVPSKPHKDAAFDKLACAHVVKVTNAEAMWLFDTDEPASVLAGFKRLGVEEVVLTSGANGSSVLHGDEITHIPADTSSSATDTVGCGDIYLSTYMHARLGGDDPVTAGRMATTHVAEWLRRKV